MIKTSRLDCGIRLVTETMAGARSACIGFWVGTGSRDETLHQSGISHFLEHLLFKGTDKRSARSIAEDIDAVGGDMNAFTTKEYTTFYVRALAEHTRLSLDVLCDIMTEPAFRPSEVDAERQVILEEVLMHLDEPADLVHERFDEAVFTGHPLGREVLGDPKVIEQVSVEEIRDFFEHHYRPANIVVAAAGDVHHDELAELVEERFLGRDRGASPVREAPGPGAAKTDVLERDTEQAHLVVGVRAPKRSAPERFSLSVMNHSLGGGLSSRLFQKVREERGLAYSISSDRVAYEDGGYLAVSVGTSPAHVAEVLGLIYEEFDAFCDSGVTEAELELAKGHLRADTLLSLEDSGSRMSRIGASQLLLGEVLSADEIAARIEAVTADEIAALSARLFSSERVLAVVGPFADEAALSRP